MTITFGGLASGLDTNAIITGLMKVEQIPLNQLNSKQAATTKAQTDLSSFMSKVTALRTASAALNDPTGFQSLNASSSDSSVSASISGNASPGSFSVQVKTLAHEQRTMSDPQTSSTDGLGQSGSISIQIGNGDAVNVDVGADDSLATIADNINHSGARVSASVLYDGSQYHLMVRGLDTGASNAVTFTENGTSLGLDNPDNTYQKANDALVKIDGIDVTRSSNVVTGAIPGVTLTLSSVSAAAGNVTVASDPSSLATKINSFVTAYNAVVSSGHFTAGYGKVAAQDPMLQGDSSVRTALSRLSNIMTSTVTGTTGKYTTLGSVGLSTQSDGSISLDTTKLNSALAADPSAVARLFTTDPSTGSTGAMGAFDKAIDSLTVGTTSILGSRVASLGSQADKLQDQATSLQARLDQYQSTLQAQFTALEMKMSNIQSQSSQMASLIGTTNFTSSSATSSTAKSSG